jgi:dihydrofolate reductase
MGNQTPTGARRDPVARERRPEVIGIAAVARNGVIGAGNDIPWRIREDWGRFKAITMGHVLIMGRKTYDSIGRPLPGRTTVVVTHDPAWRADGVIVAADLDSAFDRAFALTPTKVFVAGGGQVYAAAWDRLDTLEITEVDAEPDGDITFPAIGPDWHETDRDAREGFAFITFRRQSP